jgi:hypothetical protein
MWENQYLKKFFFFLITNWPQGEGEGGIRISKEVK